MAEPNEKQLLSVALSLIVVLLTASGIFVSMPPLESKRPAESEHARIPHGGRQDVDARLWQDPFTVTRRVTAESPEARCNAAIADTAHRPKTLSTLMKWKGDRHPVTVLPVMVPGGPYFENSESRRRARYAVVTALLNSDWVPSDEEKLGYIWTFESCIKNPWQRWVPEILPWEWFSRKSTEGSVEGVLLLWVDDDVLSRHPLRGMNEIVNLLVTGSEADGGLPCSASDAVLDEDRAANAKTKDEAVSAKAKAVAAALKKCESSRGREGARGDFPPPPKWWSATRVLGPWTSDGLQGLADDLLDAPWAKRDHHWLRFYSSGATAAANESFRAAIIERHRRPTGQPPPEAAPTPTELDVRLRDRLLRLTTPDDAVAKSLIKELKLRLTDPHPFWRWTHLGRGVDRALCSTTLVIIAERESSYARLFATAFEALADGELDGPCGLARPQVLVKSYLRGLDGVLPEGTGEPVPPAQSSRGPAPTRQEMPLPQAPPERADGRSQYDYLRRLAADLAAADTRERHEGRAGIRAIGVLGNDVYDRILVLQALRGRFPKAVFFTADLDARMIGPDVTNATRNLVVASAYGLTLNPGIQGSAPPFRDTYQTGLYLSTLVALDKRTQALHTRDFVESFRSPQLFEIGRTRAVPLSQGADERCREEKVRPATPSTASPLTCRNVHPLNEWPRFPWPQRPTLFALLVAVSTAVMLSVLTFEVLAARRSGAPAPPRERRWACIAVLGLAAVSLAWFCSRIWRDVHAHEGEPFAWLQGVSLWPTVLSRLVVLGVIIALLRYCLRKPSRDIAELRRAFGLTEPREAPAERGGGSSVSALVEPIRWLWWFNARGSDHPGRPEEPAPNADANAWLAFVERMGWGARMARIGVSAILFFLFGVGLLSIDWPNSPHRGVFSAWSDHITFLLVLFALGAILFAAVDASAMVTRFVERLGPQIGTLAITEPERQAFPNRTSIVDERVRRLATWFRLVVRLGSAVNKLIYLPFVAVLLVILTSAGGFDVWTLPLAYVLLFVISALLAVLYAARLRRQAARLRKSITDELDAQIERYELEADLTPHGPPDGGMVRQERVEWSGLPPQARARRIKQVRDEILGEREGPFGRLAEDPVVRAILLLLGGTGAITTATWYLLRPGG